MIEVLEWGTREAEVRDSLERYTRRRLEEIRRKVPLSTDRLIPTEDLIRGDERPEEGGT